MKYPTNLQETAELMTSKDYKERFIAEYYQLSLRLEGLKKMLDKWDTGTLEFTPVCSKETFTNQYSYMSAYLLILQDRASQEGIKLK